MVSFFVSSVSGAKTMVSQENCMMPLVRNMILLVKHHIIPNITAVSGQDFP
jgi:hypothetical protein